jgi:hypothetical protein
MVALDGVEGEVVRELRHAARVRSARARCLRGGGSSSSDTTSTPTSTQSSTADAKAASKAYDAAVKALNIGASNFNTVFAQDLANKDLAAIKSDTATVRTVFFDYDKTLRGIAFPASAQPAVNPLLEANGKLIADLDAIRDAKTIAEAQDLLHKLATDKASIHTKATNDLVAALRKAEGSGK